MQKNEVIKKARQFCRENNIDTYKVRIVDICKKYGLSIYEAYLPKNIDGFIAVQNKEFKKFGTNKIIVVNLLNDTRKRRFTITQAFSHYYLHQSKILKKQTTYVYYCAGNSRSEYENRIFSYNILMPEHLVKEAISAYYGLCSNYQKIHCISVLFCVSPDVAQNRLKQLHLI